MSLGKAAKISGLPLSEFVEHLGSLGIEIVRQDETTDSETGDVTTWLRFGYSLGGGDAGREPPT